MGRSDSSRKSGRRYNNSSNNNPNGSSSSSFVRKSSIRKSGRYGVHQSSNNISSSNNRGDVYTRVAIPRSKSFMNVNSQYNLQELFRELKEKEGVESIDDVLKKVVSPDGISFNEIKPVYRELLLKLAMTMSQDEIFQRSKNIIDKEKKKQKSNTKKKEKKASAEGNNNTSTIGSFLKMTFSSSSSSKNNSLSASTPSISTIPAAR